MGCGNSSPATTTKNSGGGSSSTAGRAEMSLKGSEEPAHDDKWKDYGGVYVGCPTDLSNIPQVQIGPLRESEDSSLRKPLWGEGL